MEKKKKEEKIIFSEKVDDAINGYSVGITFIFVSTFVFYKTDYFLSSQISNIIGGILGVLGILMCWNELSKSIKLKGSDDFFLGIFLLSIWGACFLFFRHRLWVNVATFFFLIFGCYGVIRGSIELVFSILISISEKSERNSKATRFKNIFLFLTQIFGFVLTTLNILELLGIISKSGG